MSNVLVKPAVTRTEKKQFMDFVWKLYRNDPNWIPPLRRNQEELVGFHAHPFYDDAEGQAFIAIRNNEVVGRIVALVHRPHMRRFREKLGFFGFLDAIDDAEVFHALFDQAAKWLAERGIHAMRGPINPSLNYELGLLIEGFDSPPTFMMTYNADYYPRRYEECGFVKSQDMYAFFGHMDMLKGLDEKLSFVVQECTRRFDLKVRRMDKSRFLAEVMTFLDIYNKSLVGTWGFTPMSKREVEHAAGSLRSLLVPEMTSIAEVNGKPVGVVLGLLDYNPRIKAINGRLFPFGFIRLLWNRRQIKYVRMISTNVLPEYQKWGVGLVLLADILPSAIQWGVEAAEFSWVLESNHLSYSSLKRGGAKLIKTYRIYDRGKAPPMSDAEIAALPNPRS